MRTPVSLDSKILIENRASQQVRLRVCLLRLRHPEGTRRSYADGGNTGAHPEGGAVHRVTCGALLASPIILFTTGGYTVTAQRAPALVPANSVPPASTRREGHGRRGATECPCKDFTVCLRHGRPREGHGYRAAGLPAVPRYSPDAPGHYKKHAPRPNTLSRPSAYPQSHY